MTVRLFVTRFALVAGVVLAGVSGAAATQLSGPLIQGGLVVGRTDPGAQVTLDGQPIRVGADGVFLLGFGRDAAPTAELDIDTPDGKHEERQLAIKSRTYKISRINGLPPREVTPDAKAMKRIRADNKEIRQVREVYRPSEDFLGGFMWPVIGRISGVFGSQRILNGKPRAPHGGVDIAAPKGTVILAPAAGKVVLADPDMYFTGRTVMLDHGHGLTSVYAHMSKILVTVGQHVAKGQPIGRIGMTGRATGPHTHWGVSLFGTRLDPALLVGPMPVAAK